ILCALRLGLHGLGLCAETRGRSLNRHCLLPPYLLSWRAGPPPATGRSPSRSAPAATNPACVSRCRRARSRAHAGGSARELELPTASAPRSGSLRSRWPPPPHPLAPPPPCPPPPRAPPP